MFTLLCALAFASAAGHPPASPATDTVSVRVAIDFGRAGKLPVWRNVSVSRGSNVVDATRAFVPVEQDVLCCSPTDVWAIDGVGPDVRRGAYWSWSLNGGAAPDFPARYVVKEGDAVQWNYGGRPPKRSSTHRIVSLLPAATDIVLAIGAEHDLVAVSHLCAQPEGRTVPRVVSTTVDSDRLSMPAIHAAVREASEKRISLYQLDEDTIRKTEPTTILSQGVCPVCAVPPEQAQALSTESDPKCAELVVLTPRTLADVAADIRRVGTAVGRSREAEIVARDFERRIEAVRASSAAKPKPRVVVLEWFDPLWVSGEWIVEMVEAAGGESLLVGKNEPSRAIAWSDLVAADPDVVVLAACSMDVERAARELDALRARPEWTQLRAVQNDRVFLLDGEHHFSAPGPKLARGVEVLGAILAEQEPRIDERDGRRIRGRD